MKATGKLLSFLGLLAEVVIRDGEILEYIKVIVIIH